jgi:hypothetical protein
LSTRTPSSTKSLFTDLSLLGDFFFRLDFLRFPTGFSISPLP